MNKTLDVMNLSHLSTDTIISLYQQGYSINTDKNISALATCQGTSCPCTLPINTSQTLTASAGSGTPPYSYHWSITKPDSTIDTSPTNYTFTYNFSQAGNYKISVYVTDSTSRTSNIDSCTITITSPQQTSGYNCVNGNCQYVTSGATYATLQECQAACTGSTAGYNCVNGNCQYVTSGATYATLQECQTACKSTCIPKWQCVIPFNGYENDVNKCPGSVDRLNSVCNPGTSGCVNCDLRSNYCIGGACIPKNYALYGSIGFGAVLLLTLTK